MELNRMQGYFRRIFSDQQKRIRRKTAQSTVLLPFLGSAHALTVGMDILRAFPGTSRLPDAACSIFPDFARLRFPDSGYQRGDESVSVLPTVTIFDSLVQSHQCAVRFDRGSEASFISEFLLSKLGLRRVNSRVNVKGLFRSSCYSRFS
ncbi:uncharacterized protein TNIN_62621 [Trichonephila inaurata madagascariensis]|uniref:Uncharacterized protein n=1 Tax=Trichonephila inaurata madagascariensis TaxID=2747483 RepID=A0A8X6WWY3_9ARAC|nr:uncharacterized protein TNIN_62621 [Trichonephila inaurata madagascariensis]